MKKRPWLKWVGMFLCLVMIVMIVWAIFRVRAANEAERVALRLVAQEYEEVMRPLLDKKTQLEAEIAEQEKIVEQEALPPAVVLLCTEPSKDVLSDVFPLTKQFFYSAAIVISEAAFPGEADWMSETDVMDLCDHGWDLCLGADRNTDLETLYQRVTDAGLPAPVGVYYPNDDPKPGQEEQALALGIHTLICYGKSAATCETEDLWYLTAYGSNESDSKSTFQSKLRNGMPQAMTVGFENKRELFSESNFGNMLKTINSYERSDDVAVMSVQEATELQLRSEDGAFSEPETEAQRYLNELKEALDSVNMRIQSMGKG